MRVFDTHQHLIYPELFNYPWIDSAPALQKSFTLEQYQALTKDFRIERSLFVEVDTHEDESAKEAAHFCGLADDPASRIEGVIAAARPEHAQFEMYLDRISHRSLKGIRRVLYTQPTAMIEQLQFKENIKLLGKRSLTFDLCISEQQYSACYDLITHCPDTIFVLDHCGRPQMAEHTFVAWRSSLQRLAECPNVYCKLSGIIEQLNPQDDALSKLAPYFDICLELFGVNRVLWGSDWPVCELGGGLDNWLECTLQWAASLNAQERSRWLYDNAAALYL